MKNIVALQNSPEFFEVLALLAEAPLKCVLDFDIMNATKSNFVLKFHLKSETTSECQQKVVVYYKHFMTQQLL